MTYELAVFDMAGTTIHDPDLVARALADALAAVDCPSSLPALRDLMGYTKPDAIRTMLAAHDMPVTDALVEQVHQDFIARMLACYRTSDEVRPMEGATEVFVLLRRRGMKIALNTAFSRDIAECLLERMGWREQGLVDAMISADQVAHGRPAADMIHALMHTCGVSQASRVVKIGDTEVDIREGRATGCGLVVAVTTGAFARAALEIHSPDAVIDHLAELPTMLEHHAASDAA